MSIREWVVENQSKYKDKEIMIVTGCKELKVARDSFLRTLNKMGVYMTNTETNTNEICLTEEEIRNKYDYKYIIQKAAQKISRGKFYKEQDFRDSVTKLNPNNFRRGADLAEFEQYKGKAGNVIYWGHPESIQKMKDDGIFQ